MNTPSAKPNPGVPAYGSDRLSLSKLHPFSFIAVLLAIGVAVVRIRLFRHIPFCGTPDACFYLGLAQNLASGQGFHTRFVYDLLQAHPTLPNTGIEYWRPGISLLLLSLKAFGGVTLEHSIVMTTLVGIVLAGAAWHLALQATGSRALALGSFALCLLSDPVWIGSSSPDSGLYYGAAVAWFLALFTVRWQGVLADAAALVCVCLAYLIRNDAALLLVPFIVVLWRRHKSASSAPLTSGPPFTRRNAPIWLAQGASPVYMLLLLAGFGCALVPMHWLYFRVLGTAFPSGTSQAFFLTDLSDFGRYRAPLSLHTLLAQGPLVLATFRLGTLATVLYRIAALMVGYPALVMLAGLWGHRGRGMGEAGSPALPFLPEGTGPGSFALAALAVYTLLLPGIGGFSALRTAEGLLPWIFTLVMMGIQRATRSSALAVSLGTAVVAANALAGFMDARRSVPDTAQLAGSLQDEAAQIDRLAGNRHRSVVLTNDPVQFSVTTGYATVELPSNGLDAIVAAAHDFHVTHVILDSTNLPAPLPVLNQQLQPVRALVLDREHRLILEIPGTGLEP